MKFYLFIILALCSTTLFAQDKPKTGPIILVGGGSIPKEAISWMKEKCPLNNYLVITLDKERSNEKWKVFFEKIQVLFPEEVKEESLNEKDGIIIDGGDQFQYLNRLDGNIINTAHKKGILILGTSAGAMVLSSNYFSATEGTITSEEAIAGERVYIGKNFCSIPSLNNTIVDTHYTERKRQGRLKVFIEKSNSDYGIGIDEATALCIEDEQREVFGEGKVFILNNDKTLVLCKK